MSNLQTTNIIRFILVPDLHIWTSKPVNRTDADILSSNLEHLDAITELGICLNCPVIFAGDFGHGASWEQRMISSVSKRLEKIKAYYILGNHDVAGRDIGTADDYSSLKFLEKSGYIKHLNSLTDLGITFYGIDSDSQDWGDFKKGKVFDCDVLVVHGPVWKVSDNIMGTFCYREFSYSPKTKLAFFADIHHGFGVIEEAGRKYVNLNVVCRRKLDEFPNPPQVLICTLSEKGLTTSVVNLPSKFEEGNMIFPKKKVVPEADLGLSKNINDIIQTSKNLPELVTKIVKAKNLDERIAKELIEELIDNNG